jgi:hypothetical protein
MRHEDSAQGKPFDSAQDKLRTRLEFMDSTIHNFLSVAVHGVSGLVNGEAPRRTRDEPIGTRDKPLETRDKR